MTDLDSMPFAPADSAPNLGAAPRRKCARHRWAERQPEGGHLIPFALRQEWGVPETETYCTRCGKTRIETLARRGRQSRNYGNRAELAVARTYGGTKVGHAGGPVDVRGAEFSTQVKTHRRLPPAEWRKAFAGMGQSSGVPRLLLRFVIGNGQPPEDYMVIPGKAWLDWFGKDEEGTND